MNGFGGGGGGNSKNNNKKFVPIEVSLNACTIIMIFLCKINEQFSAPNR